MRGIPKLRMTSWNGEWPMIGHYLKTERGRTAFLVVDIVPPRCRQARFAFVAHCERTSPADLPVHAVVHAFYWHRRTSTSRAAPV